MPFRKQRDRWVFGSTQILRAHWRTFLPGTRRLSCAQKRGYLGGWVRWWSDAIGLLAALAAVVWTFASLVTPLHLPSVEATVAVLAAMAVPNLMAVGFVLGDRLAFRPAPIGGVPDASVVAVAG